MLYDRQPLPLESVLNAPASLLPYFLSSAYTSHRQTTQRPTVTNKSNFIFFRAVWCLHVQPHPAYPPQRAARRRTGSAAARCCRSPAGPAAQRSAAPQQHRPAPSSRPRARPRNCAPRHAGSPGTAPARFLPPPPQVGERRVPGGGSGAGGTGEPPGCSAKPAGGKLNRAAGVVRGVEAFQGFQGIRKSGKGLNRS